MSDEVSFLPKNFKSETPKYLVWWTGTLGQAEWLISHSDELRGSAVARECPKDLESLPLIYSLLNESAGLNGSFICFFYIRTSASNC
jgi:hypothetical protein